MAVVENLQCLSSGPDALQFIGDTAVQARRSLQAADKIELFRGMLLTRACDNALKHMFLAGEITYEGKPFQGKGFRSLGQEAIFGATYLLARGKKYQLSQGYVGDVAAPLIRDLGVFLCMSDCDLVTALNAQAGKDHAPCFGRDLHVGDSGKGVMTPAAPLAIATASLVGMALAFKRQQESRVCVSFIGEGGTSLGEWHEAINFAAVQELPMIFCVENNQTALSTKRHLQCRAQKFSDKAAGYGIPGLTIDGNDIEDVAAYFFAASAYARIHGPVLLELQTMRMCGHAHHDDMLYLGYDPQLDFHIPKAKPNGYVDLELYQAWALKDPILRYHKELLIQNIIHEEDVIKLKEHAKTAVKDALEVVKNKPWPKFDKQDNELVFKAPLIFVPNKESIGYQFDASGKTYLAAIAQGCQEAFDSHPNCVMIGEDVAPPYGNAFRLFGSIMDEYADRFINTPISENAIVGALVGMAMAGMRPIGEMQFNDFVASAMNQVVNNLAKSYFRLGQNLPVVLRMPYGGLRRAGPYHSQDTSPWFYRTPGLKIMAPSTPEDAYGMLVQAVLDPDPVLFYEHIGLYRDPKIKQRIEPGALSAAGARVAKSGTDLSLISYGAFVHRALEASDIIAEQYGKSVEVIDLRYLSPIDLASVCDSITKCSRAMLVGEDAKRGSILESLSSQLHEELFEYLDAPIKVLGSRDVPVPYAPPLEDEYLVSTRRIVAEAMALLRY